jgi:hypothetical protein
MVPFNVQEHKVFTDYFILRFLFSFSGCHLNDRCIYGYLSREVEGNVALSCSMLGSGVQLIRYW